MEKKSADQYIEEAMRKIERAQDLASELSGLVATSRRGGSTAKEEIIDLLSRVQQQASELQAKMARDELRFAGWAIRGGAEMRWEDRPVGAIVFRDDRAGLDGLRPPPEYAYVDAIFDLATMLRRQQWVQP